MNGDDVGKLFTTDGKDAWCCVSYCAEPTIRFENLETKTVIGGAVGCLNVRDFKPLTIQGDQ
jgi:hypothetical protein